jgi:uncharacterized membrane protein YfcA
LEYVLIGLAGIGAGLVNALAGGGTLISFPVLMMLGLPAVAANVTNTVALCPGYLGATLAQSGDLRGQKRRLWLCLPAGAIGGVLGGLLLLVSGEKIFSTLVPYLILLASGLLAVQDPVRRWVMHRVGHHVDAKRSFERWAAVPVMIAAIYGGYFGAGLSVIVLAVLGLVIDDSLTRLSALKQGVAFATNTAAAVFFLFSGQVVWSAALVMAVGAIVGGTLGGRLAGRIRPELLRRLVVAIGVVVGLCYLIPR